VFCLEVLTVRSIPVSATWDVIRCIERVSERVVQTWWFFTEGVTGTDGDRSIPWSFPAKLYVMNGVLTRVVQAVAITFITNECVWVGVTDLVKEAEIFRNIRQITRGPASAEVTQLPTDIEHRAVFKVWRTRIRTNVLGFIQRQAGERIDNRGGFQFVNPSGVPLHGELTERGVELVAQAQIDTLGLVGRNVQLCTVNNAYSAASSRVTSDEAAVAWVTGGGTIVIQAGVAVGHDGTHAIRRDGIIQLDFPGIQRDVKAIQPAWAVYKAQAKVFTLFWFQVDVGTEITTDLTERLCCTAHWYAGCQAVSLCCRSQASPSCSTAWIQCCWEAFGDTAEEIGDRRCTE